jgi:8-oxo-dGTP diphosphatase
MKASKRTPILAAGGIVVREDDDLIAVVRLRKNNAWVLPKGKLKPREDALTAARREVLEETGHAVAVEDYLGTLSQASGGRRKTVQFWRMRAAGPPVGKLMRDVKRVKWLPLDKAIKTLTYPAEREFLKEVGHVALYPNGYPAAPKTIPQRIGAWLHRIMRGRLPSSVHTV